MIIDAFMFFDEFDVLEWRLHELRDVVDYFVLVESTVTHQGKVKPLHFQEEQERSHRFDNFIDRIQIVTVTDTPLDVPHPYEREVHQRNAITLGVRALDASLYDTVLISDVDEIPRASVVHPHPVDSVAMRYGQTLYHSFVNMHCLTEPIWYKGTVATHAEILFSTTPQALRLAQWVSAYENAGWHFSFMGGVQAMQRKLAAWQHYEWNKAPYNTVENLERARREGRDWDVTRDMRYEFVPVDDSYPLYLRQQIAQGRFLEYIGPEKINASS